MEIVFYIVGGLCAIAPLLAGMILRFFPPKYGNEIYGFSTEASRYNPQTWAYAHKLCGNIMLTYAAISIPIFAALLIVFHHFFYRNFYLILIFGFVLAIGCVIIAGITTQTKTRKFSYTFFYQKPEVEKENNENMQNNDE